MTAMQALGGLVGDDGLPGDGGRGELPAAEPNVARALLAARSALFVLEHARCRRRALVSAQWLALSAVRLCEALRAESLNLYENEEN